MFKPKYRVLLTGICFPKDKVVCLGTQLTSIINSIKEILPSHTWYGADVEAVGKGAMKYQLNNNQLKVIGSDLQFIEYCSAIDQFIWGNFVCVDANFPSQNVESIELETEDESFRVIPCEGILVEIRTFDTSYFEVYAEDISLLNKISKAYNVKIEKRENEI